MNELQWGNLDAWVWALLVFGLLLGFVWMAIWRRAKLDALASRGPLPAQLKRAGGGRHLLRAIMVLLSAGLLVVALMRPQHGTRATELKNLGIDIVIALDSSKSMKVKDVVPDRLQAANLEIHRLLDKLSGGRVALVPFAGLAFVQAPLTSDFEVIKTYLEGLRVEDMPRGGTAIGRAIVEAVRILLPPEDLEESELEEVAGEGASEGEEEVDADSADVFKGSKHKAIILFTDGEDHEGDPMAAAKLAADHGITIFTVGVGTAQGRPVPMINPEGEYIGTVKGPDGRTPLFSELNMKLLGEVADATGGQSFHLGPTGMSDGLLEAIDRMEKQEYEATFRHLGDDRFQLALIPAFVLLLIEALLGSRGRRRRRRRRQGGAA